MFSKKLLKLKGIHESLSTTPYNSWVAFFFYPSFDQDHVWIMFIFLSSKLFLRNLALEMLSVLGVMLGRVWLLFWAGRLCLWPCIYFYFNSHAGGWSLRRPMRFNRFRGKLYRWIDCIIFSIMAYFILKPIIEIQIFQKQFLA